MYGVEQHSFGLLGIVAAVAIVLESNPIRTLWCLSGSDARDRLDGLPAVATPLDLYLCIPSRAPQGRRGIEERRAPQPRRNSRLYQGTIADGERPAALRRASFSRNSSPFFSWQSLYFLRLPQGQGSLRPTLATRRWVTSVKPGQTTLPPPILKLLPLDMSCPRAASGDCTLGTVPALDRTLSTALGQQRDALVSRLAEHGSLREGPR